MNSATPAPEIQKDFKVIIGNIYTLPTPIRVKSLPIKSKRTHKISQAEKERKILNIKVIEKRGDEFICTGHKVKELEPGKFKSGKRKYLFSLPIDFKFN